jgi:hypothetical protein
MGFMASEPMPLAPECFLRTCITERRSMRVRHLRRSWKASPVIPGKYAEVGSRRIGQHRNELQQIIVRVLEIDRSGRHPGQDDWRISRKPSQVCRLNPTSSQSFRSGVQFRERNLEGHMANTHWHASGFPKTEHRLPRSADPKECDPALGNDVCQWQAQPVPVKSHGSFEVCDRQMRFKQIIDRNGALTVIHERYLA